MAGSFQINDRGLIIEMNAPDPGASFHGFSGLQE